MKKVLYILIPLVLIILIVLRLLSNKKTAEENVYHYDKEQIQYVQTETLALSRVASERSFTGKFDPYKEAHLSSEIQGKINSILVDEGSSVTKGQALIRLDDALLQQQLNTVNVQIQNIKSEHDIQLQNNQLQIEGFQEDVNRYQVLAEADAIQGVKLEKAELQLATAKVQRKTLMQQSALKNTQAQKITIEEQIKKTIIRAPFSGVITAKLSEIGEFAVPSKPLLQITDISKLKFSIYVPETGLIHFSKDKSYEVIVDIYPDQIFNSSVTMIGVRGSIANNFPVQFLVKNTIDWKIKSGMFGKVKLKNENPKQELIIAASAIINSGTQSQVYLIKDGKAVLQPIKISRRTQDKAVIEQGLHEGDKMITGGFINLYDGANVEAKN